MRQLLWVFRGTALAALLLGLANLLLGFLPPPVIDTHMLFGVLAVLSAWGLLWRQRGSGLGRAGMGLAAVLLVLGLGQRLRWWGAPGVDLMGLVHLAVALGMMAVVEMSAARARRAIPRP
ncbi:MAG: hypothetical protein HY689_08245 [Chloroflexi bacterium]|nr:hypothetical protein [Chloroflexota bacterium]